MKKLNEILSVVKFTNSGGQNLNGISVRGITADSRNVKPGYVFVAVKGTAVDGHDFIPKAFELGAVAIIAEHTIEHADAELIFVVAVASDALGKIAHKFYDSPTEHLKLICITGTIGKTSVATLCYNL
ncbi:MAG: UDP-N-acetylmuramoyl-L-alanyl-D-glutamate--2,6-diaminopimelate ligase, partial [Chitinophagales bacterium]|nr:UDP-N-acetylmuramoyl-L-alanyl-D-glutamate--2,6-diaminopimelate ligase [Chitinophagales bacterium]